MIRRHTFQKTILLFTCISFVLLLCFWGIFKVYFQPKFRKHMLEEAQLSCNLSQKLFDEQLTTMMDAAANRFLSEGNSLGDYSPIVLGKRNELKTSDILPIRKILQELSNQFYSHDLPLFYAIDVYYPNSDIGITSNAGLVFSEEGGKPFDLRRDNVKWMLSFDQSLQRECFIQQYQIRFSDKSPEKVVSFSRILHFYDSASIQDIPMVLTFVLRKSTLNLVLASDESSEFPGWFFLQEKDGGLAQISGDDTFPDIRQLQQGRGNHSDYSLLAAENRRGSIQVLRLLDTKEMEHTLASQQTFFLIAMLVVFLLAMILSYSASKNLYRPLGKLMRKVGNMEYASQDTPNEYSYLETAMSALAERADSLETTLQKNRPMIKNTLLIQLFYGHLNIEEELEGRCRLSGIRLTGPCFFAAVIKLDLMAYSPDEENDAQFIKIRLMESVEQNSTETLECYCTETEYNEIAVVLSGSREAAQAVFPLLEKTVASFENLLHCAVIIGVSQPQRQLNDLRMAYRQACSATDNAFFNEKTDKKLFFYQAGWNENLHLPADITDSFWQAFKPPNLTEAMEAYHEVLEEMSKGVYTAAYCRPLLENMEAQLSDLLRRHGIDWPAAVRSSLRAYSEHFMQAKIMLHAMENEKAENANQVNLQIVLNAVTSDLSRNLSLDEAAELVHFSPVYFSKVFKETLGINYKDYVQEVKMRRAIELLADERLAIQEIAEQLGYANANYFGKRFKQYFRMTPGSYRNHLHTKNGIANENKENTDLKIINS